MAISFMIGIMEYKKSDPLFAISVASQLVHLHPRTLMLYEKAGLVSPFRTKTERRRYSQADIEKIKFIHYLTKQKRVNLAGIRLLFEIIDLAQKHNLNVSSQLFPDFKS